MSISEIVAVVAYGRILPSDLLELAPLGAVNVHASLLPLYRGAAPVAWAIARGETVTGVTTMRMSGQLDAGDILMQRSEPIEPTDTTDSLQRRLAELGAGLLIETLDGLRDGTLTSVAQDASKATLAPMLTKKDGVIDWTLTAEEIARRVRAFDPWPGARTTTGGSRQVRIWKASPSSEVSEHPPGTIVAIVRPRTGSLPGDAGGALVACGHASTLLVIEVQPDGRRRMPAMEAVSGRHLREGDRLGEG